MPSGSGRFPAALRRPDGTVRGLLIREADLPGPREPDSHRSPTLDLHLTLTGRRDVTGQLYRQLRDAILDGRLRAGSALPSSRELTRTLDVSRNTVLLVYDRLRAEGFVTARGGSGTYVSDGVRPRTTEPALDSPLAPSDRWTDIPEAFDMSATVAELDLRPGVPDVSAFPLAAWRARVARQFHPPALGAGTHIDPAGLPALRDAIRRHIAAARGVRVAPDDLLITSGSQQAIDLITRVLLEPGDTVSVEDPCYPLPRYAFRAHGCQVHGVPVDGDGLVVDAIPPGTRLVYVTPSHQYPLGMAMSLPRRLALLDWARRNDGIVIEDDYDSEFRYGGRPLEPLQTLDDSGRVFYVGSLSKVMLPTLRLGYVAVPHPLTPAFRKAKYLADWHTNVPLQGAAAAFIDDGLLAQHVRRMRRSYEIRHRLIVRMLERRASETLTVLPSVGGLHLAVLLHDVPACDDAGIALRARADGVAVLPLSYHYVCAKPRAGLLLGFGAVPTERIDDALEILLRQL